MKLLLLLSACMLSGLITFAQSSIEEKVTEVYGEIFLQNSQTNNPGILNYFEDVNSCYSITPYNTKYSSALILENIELHSKSSESISIDSFLAEYDAGDANFLKLKLKPSSETQIYILGDSGRVLVITSVKSKKR